MKNNRQKIGGALADYTAPSIEILHVQAEQCFATSYDEYNHIEKTGWDEESIDW